MIFLRQLLVVPYRTLQVAFKRSRKKSRKPLSQTFKSSIVDDIVKKMLSRSALSRGAQLAARTQGCSQLAQRRGYAAVASSAPSPLSFDTTEVTGVKVAARDSHGPTTKLAVVAKAGTRYQGSPGLTVGLEEFAFKVSLCLIRLLSS